MYTATIKQKTDVGGALEILVEFSDGATTVVDSCIPQDADGFKHWVKSRLATFNSSSVLKTALVDNTLYDPTDPVVPPPVPTQAEIDRAEWLKNYEKWVKVKTTLIDTGIITEANPQVALLKATVTTNLKAEYLDYIVV